MAERAIGAVPNDIPIHPLGGAKNFLHEDFDQ